MATRSFLLHALTPLHAGTGQALGHIDLPIARYKATGIPFLPASSIKGVFRDRLGNGPHGAVIFGPAVNDADPDRFAGAVVWNDARLLLLPVRSLRGTFAWVTSPLLLRLAARDLDLAIDLPNVETVERRACVTAESRLPIDKHVFFEDIECGLQADPFTVDLVSQWAAAVGALLFPGEAKVLAERFAVVDDETMTFLWETATQVDARVRIDSATHVVAKGALWYEESLPSETVLVSRCIAEPPRKPGAPPLAPDEIFEELFGPSTADLQFGGKSTVGRGRMKIIPAPVAAGEVAP